MRFRLLFLFALAVTGACSRPPAEGAPVADGPARPATATSSLSLGPTASSPAGSARTRQKIAGPPHEGCDGLFEPPAGAVQLCNEHVLGNVAEIAWSSWAVTTSPWDTFQLYPKRAHDCGAGFVTKPPILSVSKDNKRLSIHDVKDEHMSCETKPDAAHPTVIVISEKYDRVPP